MGKLSLKERMRIESGFSLPKNKSITPNKDCKDRVVISVAELKKLFFSINKNRHSKKNPLKFSRANSTNSIISEKPIDLSTNSVIIKSKEMTDGGPGSGNHNHEGQKGQVGGSKHSASAKEIAKINRRLIGKKTHDGITIKKVSAHAYDRLSGRLISVGRIERMLNEGKVSPGYTERTQCYDIKGSRMVVDKKTGTIVSIMWRKGNK